MIATSVLAGVTDPFFGLNEMFNIVVNVMLHAQLLYFLFIFSKMQAPNL